MHQEIHQKSLRFTLTENKLKLKKAVITLMSLCFFISTLFFVFVLYFTNAVYALVVVFVLIYTAFLIYTILQLWQTQKKITKKLKKMH